MQNSKTYNKSIQLQTSRPYKRGLHYSNWSQLNTLRNIQRQKHNKHLSLVFNKIQSWKSIRTAALSVRNSSNSVRSYICSSKPQGSQTQRPSQQVLPQAPNLTARCSNDFFSFLASTESQLTEFYQEVYNNIQDMSIGLQMKERKFKVRLKQLPKGCRSLSHLIQAFVPHEHPVRQASVSKWVSPFLQKGVFIKYPQRLKKKSLSVEGIQMELSNKRFLFRHRQRVKRKIPKINFNKNRPQGCQCRL